MWYHEVIGKGRCPIVDTWWQTETGMIMIAPLPGAIADQARLARRGRCRASSPKSSTSTAIRCRPGQGGFLVITKPWPAMLRTIFGDDERYRQRTGRTVPHVYFTADGARQDEDGYIWVMGRVDDVLNVVGPSPEHDGSRERPGPSCEGRGGGGRRQAGRHQGGRHFLLRHAQGRHRGQRRAEEGAASARRQGDRRPGPPGRNSLHRMRCRRRAPARSCGGCCATSPAARRPRGTRRRWRICRCWRNCAKDEDLADCQLYTAKLKMR